MVDTIIIREGELCLKGGNRRRFEDVLLKNIHRQVPELAAMKERRSQGSVYFHTDGAIADATLAAMRERLPLIPGVARFAFATRVEKDLQRIMDVAVDGLKNVGSTSFRVNARRSDKSFPLESPEIEREVGAYILTQIPELRVQLKNPEINVEVEIANDAAYVATETYEGADGLPVGVSGSVAVMLSGGIDSPVAAWKMMRRGCRAVFVHFHSYPYVGRESIEKVKRLAAQLDRSQGGSVLYLVAFGDVQREIVARAQPSARVVLYRRSMLRIAERVAAREGATALATGDALGQVASQTLENMNAITDAVRMPVLRPLVGENKRDIVSVAERIGTYRISIEAHDDCCSLFVPAHPITDATPHGMRDQEARYDIAALEASALAAAERITINETAHAV